MGSEELRPTFDRRQFLGGGVVIGGGLSLASGLSSIDRAGAATIERATRVSPAGSDVGAIKHVVFLMQENRSFDHYFGSYKGVRGFNDHARIHSERSPSPSPRTRLARRPDSNFPSTSIRRPSSANAPATSTTTG